MSLAFDRERPFYVMGIINTTPDSFYDGGNFSSLDNAMKQAEKLIREGADIIDIGGESSRPGADSVSEGEEIDRVIPFVEKVKQEFDITISVDTVKSKVAQLALDAGASIINDISGGQRDPKMISLIAQKDCYAVVMHSRSTPKDMQDNPHFDNVVQEVILELRNSVDSFLEAGVAKEKIILDPGIGFAKRLEDNLTLLKEISQLKELGYELLIGTSRKSFIGLLTDSDPKDRLAGSLGSIANAFNQGARFFRVHDVKETVDFLKVMSRINRA